MKSIFYFVGISSNVSTPCDISTRLVSIFPYSKGIGLPCGVKFLILLNEVLCFFSPSLYFVSIFGTFVSKVIAPDSTIDAPNAPIIVAPAPHAEIDAPPVKKAAAMSTAPKITCPTPIPFPAPEITGVKCTVQPSLRSMIGVVLSCSSDRYLLPTRIL